MNSSYLLGGSFGVRESGGVHNLPTELLSYVFELVTHALSQDERNTLARTPFHPQTIRAPVWLSAVNRRWRHVALSTPSLWTSIFVSVDNIIDYSGDERNSSSFCGSKRLLDVESLAYFLLRSGNCTLDIFIDGRDPEWDFSDYLDGDDADDGRPSARRPFDAQITTHILDILGHHVYRWRSMTIFSDTWAPLHAALCCLSVPRVGQGSFSNSRRGASCLETLKLMQCDEYNIRNEHFGSGVLKEPITTPFAGLAGYPDGPSSHVLPARLRSISLCGVRVNWSDFTRFISGTWSGLSNGIENLELSYHHRDVRPDVTAFQRILEGCANLRSLILKHSGPQWVGRTPQGPSVPLPRLEALHPVFDSAEQAALTMSTLCCPSLKALTLEDGTEAEGSPNDASLLLIYCGTGALRTPPRPGNDSTYDSLSCLPHSESRSNVPLFPSVQALTLEYVSASCSIPYALLLAGLPNLRRLALRHVPKYAFGSLLPQPVFCDWDIASDIRTLIPCTRLESIEATHTETDVYSILGSILRERAKLGAPRIPEVMLRLEGGHCSVPGPTGLAYEEITCLDVVKTSERDAEHFD
ncbi:hypothetical protein EV401DRAFT_2262764 [Pisolithus croceorrhizus]|nr:hypothetical protein EV401DRAFT_2262764 [Pisolithus croceorrhizus]